MLVHKQDTRHFLIGELRLAFASRLVSDDTGETVGTVVAASPTMYDHSLPDYFTANGGASFHRISYWMTPYAVRMDIAERAETDETYKSALRLAVAKWSEILE